MFTHQLIFHPILRGYDYFIKHDLDVWWRRLQASPSLFQSMQQQGCVFMHTFYNGYGSDCGLDAPEVVEDWANRTYGIRPASYGNRWWKGTDYFYGNLLGGWLGWMRSEENRQLADFMYEDPTTPGYFKHRWGDQPPYPKSLGMSARPPPTSQRTWPSHAVCTRLSDHCILALSPSCAVLRVVGGSTCLTLSFVAVPAPQPSCPSPAPSATSPR